MSNRKQTIVDLTLDQFPSPITLLTIQQRNRKHIQNKQRFKVHDIVIYKGQKAEIFKLYDNNQYLIRYPITNNRSQWAFHHVKAQQIQSKQKYSFSSRVNSNNSNKRKLNRNSTVHKSPNRKKAKLSNNNKTILITPSLKRTTNHTNSANGLQIRFNKYSERILQESIDNKITKTRKFRRRETISHGMIVENNEHNNNNINNNQSNIESCYNLNNDINNDFLTTYQSNMNNIFEKLKERNDSKTENNELKKQFVKCKNENGKLQTEKNKLQTEKDKLKIENNKFINKNDKLRKENDKYKGEIELLNGTSKRLYSLDLQQLNELELKLQNGLNSLQQAREMLLDNKYNCVVCLNKPKNISFVDGCNHIAICMKCESSLNPKKCPICYCSYKITQSVIF